MLFLLSITMHFLFLFETSYAKTAVYREQMDKAYAEMGELQYMAEEIDELFAE